MLFKEIKEGSTLWVLDKAAVEVSEEKVAKVSPPYFDSNFSGVAKGCVMDITVGEGKSSRTFTLHEGSDTGYAQDLMITPDRGNVIREIEDIRRKSEHELSLAGKYELDISKCNEALLRLCPEKRREADFEKRLKAIEEGFSRMEELLKGLKP